jgi:hypothetical protein
MKRRFPTKAEEFIDEMGNYRILAMSSTPWSEFAGWLGNW